jgi:hypothetical protein
MTDIEQGLKEAVAEAAAKRSTAQGDVGPILRRQYDKAIAGAKAIHGEHGDSYRGDIASGERQYVHANGFQHMTAPQLIDHIETLTKSAAVLEGLAFDLSNDLAGHVDYAGAKDVVASSGQGLEMTVFDRMGVRLLELTRTIESIEREIKRSLGAVKP